MNDKVKLRAVKLQIRKVLLEEWDPIGVRDEPMAQDEYDAYLGGIYKLLERDVPHKEIADHLHHTETVNMGCPERDRRKLLDVAWSLKRLVL